jgi:stage II sporulation protein D
VRGEVLKKFALIFCAFLLVFSGATSARAISIPELVKIGLFYGDSEKNALKVETDGGFLIGYFSGREFSKIFDIPQKSLIARKDTYFTFENGAFKEFSSPGALSASSGKKFGPYHLQYCHDVSIETAQKKVTELKARGIQSFVASIGLTINVWGGNFLTENDAKTAASKSPVPASVCWLSDKRIALSDPLTGETVFLFGHMGFGLGLKPIGTDFFKLTSGKTLAYRDFLELRRISGGGMTAINVISPEKYLKGCVAREMYTNWPIEALKAQAVVARTYLIRNLNKHKSRGFDLCNTVECQVYTGLDAERTSSINAASQTRGKILTYNGAPASAVYFSSVGPFTESAANVWGCNHPYLVKVPSNESAEVLKNTAWTHTISRARATEIMARKGHDVGEVTNIEVLEHTPSGGALRLKVSGSRGEKIFERERTRFIFGNITPSQMFSVTSEGDTTGEINPELNMTDGAKNLRKNIANIYAASDLAQKTFIKNIFTAGSNGNKKYSLETGPDSFIFTGIGNGHGVGLSQYGAKNMANCGSTCDQILRHFYTGITISSAE